MNIARSSSAFRRQHGVTLIELMVSITIGLFILIAIGTAYITTTSTGRQRENQSELNEPARIVMQQLRRELSLAGYVDVMDLGVSGLLPDPDSRTAQAFALFNPLQERSIQPVSTRGNVCRLHFSWGSHSDGPKRYLSAHGPCDKRNIGQFAQRESGLSLIPESLVACVCCCNLKASCGGLHSSVQARSLKTRLPTRAPFAVG